MHYPEEMANSLLEKAIVGLVRQIHTGRHTFRPVFDFVVAAPQVAAYLIASPKFLRLLKQAWCRGNHRLTTSPFLRD